MSQSALATALGIKFQQVQKYEKGKSRVSAVRLQGMADALDVPISYFFPEPDATGATPPALMAADAAQALSAFEQIESPTLRKRALELLQAMAEAQRVRSG